MPLGGSWVAISGVVSPLIWVISRVTALITLLITSHEPPSSMEAEFQRLELPSGGGAWVAGQGRNWGPGPEVPEAVVI